MKKLNTIDADTLQAIAYEPISFLVDDLLPQGLHPHLEIIEMKIVDKKRFSIARLIRRLAVGPGGIFACGRIKPFPCGKLAQRHPCGGRKPAPSP